MTSLKAFDDFLTMFANAAANRLSILLFPNLVVRQNAFTGMAFYLALTERVSPIMIFSNLGNMGVFLLVTAILKQPATLLSI